MTKGKLPRGLYSFGLLFAFLGQFHSISKVDGIPHPRGLSAYIDFSILASPVALQLGMLVFVISLIAFTLHKGEEVACVIIIGLLNLGIIIQSSQWPGDNGANRAVILPCVSCIAYLLGRRLSLRKGDSSLIQEEKGVDAACGTVAILYLLAGISKISGSTIAWAKGSNLALHITVHSYDSVPVLRDFRLFIAENLALCTLFGVGTLIIECGAICFVVPRLRIPIAIAISLLHLSVALVMGLHHYDWMFVAVGLAFYSRMIKQEVATPSSPGSSPVKSASLKPRRLWRRR
jgi:hypothetical protein